MANSKKKLDSDGASEELYDLLESKLRGHSNLRGVFNHHFGSLNEFKTTIDSGNIHRTLENLLHVIYDLVETTKKQPTLDMSSTRAESALSENIMTTITSANNKI